MTTVQQYKAWLLLVFWVVLGCFVAPPLATAHQFAPALLEVEEVEPGEVNVRWKQPSTKVVGNEIRPVLPGSCVGVSRPTVDREGTGMVATWSIRCDKGLVGTQVGVEEIETSRANVLLRVVLADGRSMRQVLSPGQPSYLIPEKEGKFEVFSGYVKLGTEHILSGWDHLLFLVALVLLTGATRTLIWTVTAFTFGHSVTLALAALGLVNFPPAPIEVLIAFSIYILGVDLALRDAGRITWIERAPWLVAALFGLLHGLGFAGALTDVGLPSGDIPLALFAFNIGIEVGQLAFVACVLVLWAGVRALPIKWPALLLRLPAYAIGSVAAFWIFERLYAVI